MNLLPDNFPVNSLPDTEVNKVNWFYRRYVEDFNEQYGEGHFILAAYAAVPVFLTPDLLYKIWQNFNSYNWGGDQMSVHRIAVADILLSPLCREIGFELYEMHAEIRLALLEWLNKEVKTKIGQERGLRRIEEVAQLVEKYHETPTVAGQRWGKNYTESQSVEAISYSNPALAAKRILENLRNSAGETEMLRNMDALIKTRHRLEKLDVKNKIDFTTFSNQADLMAAWSSLIQKNNALFLEQLNQQPRLLSLLKETGSDGIEIKIEDGIVEKVELITSRKLKVLAIGAMTVDLQNARNFIAAIQEAVPAAETILLEDSEVFTDNKVESFYDQMRAFNNKHSINDDLLLYISQTTSVTKGQPSFLNFMGHQIPATSIKDLTAKSNCASITMILDMGGETIPSDWVSLENPRNVVFSFSLDFKTKERNLFSTVLINQIKNGGLGETNRNFFQGLMKQVKEINSRSPKTEELLPVPEFAALPQMQNRFFLQGKNEIGELQNLLRITSYYDGRLTGKWDKQTSEAFEKYRSEHSDYKGKSKRDFIKHLEEINIHKRQTDIPIFVIVFSDKQKQLTQMAEEREEILRMLRPTNNILEVETIILDDPKRNDVVEVMMNKANRGRVQLFYYSGFDEQGDFILHDGVFTDFDQLLDYQENMHIVVSNTCRSWQVARSLVQCGARLAVGALDYVNDDLAKKFGVKFIENVKDNQPFENFWRMQQFNFAPREKGSKEKSYPFELYRSLTNEGNLTWPESWYSKKEKQEQIKQNGKLLSVVIGVEKSEAFDKEQLPQCKENAQRFGKFLDEYSQKTDKQVLQNASLDGFITRQQATDAVQLFKEAKDGDVCVFFYSGGVGVNRSDNNDIIDFVFSDDSIRAFSLEYLEPWISKEIVKLVAGKKVTLFCILDLHNAFTVSFDEPVLPIKASSASVIVLQNSLSSDLLKKTRKDEPNGDNHFMEHLLDLFNSGNYSFTYSQLFDRLKASLVKQSLRQPQLIVNPNDAIFNTIFSSFPIVNDSLGGRVEEPDAIAEGRLFLVAFGMEKIRAFSKVNLPYSRENAIKFDAFINGFSKSNGKELIKSVSLAGDLSRAMAMDAIRLLHQARDGDTCVLFYSGGVFVSEEDNDLFVDFIFSDDTNNLSKIRENSENTKKLITKALLNKKIHFLSISDIHLAVSVNHTADFESQEKTKSTSITIENCTYGQLLMNRISIEENSRRDNAFMVELLKLLNETKGYDTYRSFFDKLTERVSNKTNSRAPQIAGVPDETIDQTLFFNGLKKPVKPEPKESFEERVKKLYNETPITVTDDLQKNRWGGLAEKNNIRLSAKVKRRFPGVFAINLTAESFSKVPYKGKIAFFMHDTFKEIIEYKTFAKGKAELNVTAYEAFTVGAYTEDGTMLELDLNQQKGYPKGFYYTDVPNDFKEKVKKVYDSTPVTVKDDLQKNRWGKSSENAGKKLSATVEKSLIPGYFKIAIKLSSEKELLGCVAFFLHDSYKPTIRYRNAVGGEAELFVNAYEAFTIGAYTLDGTRLELDLNEVKGFPPKFYYKK